MNMLWWWLWRVYVNMWWYKFNSWSFAKRLVVTEKLFSNVKFLSQREKNQKKKRETESIEFEENEIYLLEYNS